MADDGWTDGALPVRLTYLVKQLELAIRRHIDRAVREFGLTTPQYTALSVLDRHPGMSSAQLARRSFVSPQAANEMVVALERKALVERHAEGDKPRVLEMQLTVAGRAALERCDAGVGSLERRMVRDLSTADTDVLRRLLRSCLGAIADASGPTDTGRARADPPPKGRGQGVGA